MKRTLVLTALATMLVSVPAFAQSAPIKDNPARTTTTPPAVANPSDVNKTTAAPVAGKNSFTEGQVVERLEKNGYTNISQVMKDEQSSIWHAKAMKAGAAVDVAVDYQGNISAK
jgi:hypothetical protein